MQLSCRILFGLAVDANSIQEKLKRLRKELLCMLD